MILQPNILPRSPASPAEWEAYFDLRWRILRQPWGQPRGSERDSLDESAFHLPITGDDGRALACGRLQLNSPSEAQIRYMAVDENVQGRGYGSAILAALEAETRRSKASHIVLNAGIMPLSSTAGMDMRLLVRPRLSSERFGMSEWLKRFLNYL